MQDVRGLSVGWSAIALAIALVAMPASAQEAGGSTGSSASSGTDDAASTTGGASTGATGGASTGSTGSTSTTTQQSSSSSTGTSSSSATARGSSGTLSTDAQSSRTTGAGGATTSTASAHASAGTTGAATAAASEEEEEEEDDGRDVDFLWIEIEGGVSTANLVAFSQQNFSGGGATATAPSFNEVSGVGPFAGLGVGFRVYFIAVGARATLASYPGFEIGNIGGDVQLRLPVPVVEPYIRVGFGYAWQGSANYTNASASTTTTTGWSFDSALGLDIFLANWFTLGAGAGLNLLNLTRQSDPTVDCMGLTDFCPQQEGDAIGYQLRFFVQVGFHL